MFLVPDSLPFFIFKKRFVQCYILWLCFGKQINWNLIAPQSRSPPPPQPAATTPGRGGMAPAGSARCWPPWDCPHDHCPAGGMFLPSAATSVWAGPLCRGLESFSLSSALQREGWLVLGPQAALTTSLVVLMNTLWLSVVEQPSGLRCVSSLHHSNLQHGHRQEDEFLFPTSSFVYSLRCLERPACRTPSNSRDFCQTLSFPSRSLSVSLSVSLPLPLPPAFPPFLPCREKKNNKE